MWIISKLTCSSYLISYTSHTCTLLSLARPLFARYTADDKQTDQFTFSNPDFLVLFAAGNDGLFSLGSQGANCKNCISVGAGERSQPTLLSSYSGRGPTFDGRFKPDLVTTGTPVAAAKFASKCAVTDMTGTSMACPLAASMATLIRQYFVDGFYPSGAANAADKLEPTAALIKAMLVTSTVPLKGIADAGVGVTVELGTVPSAYQGHGRATLSRILRVKDAKGSTSHDGWFELQVHDKQSIKVGEVKTFTAPALKCGVEALRVTLTWTDPPASTSAMAALVNDLDLDVSVGGKVVRRGNHRDGYDRINNLEKVVLPSDIGSTGPATITVRAHKIAIGTSQEFVLVIAIGPEDPVPACSTDLCGTGAATLQKTALSNYMQCGKGNCRYRSYKHLFKKYPIGQTCVNTNRNDCVKQAGCAWCQWSLGGRCTLKTSKSLCYTDDGETWHTTAGTIPALYIPTSPVCGAAPKPPAGPAAKSCSATSTNLGIPGLTPGLGPADSARSYPAACTVLYTASGQIQCDNGAWKVGTAKCVKKATGGDAGKACSATTSNLGISDLLVGLGAATPHLGLSAAKCGLFGREAAFISSGSIKCVDGKWQANDAKCTSAGSTVGKGGSAGGGGGGGTAVNADSTMTSMQTLCQLPTKEAQCKQCLGMVTGGANWVWCGFKSAGGVKADCIKEQECHAVKDWICATSDDQCGGLNLGSTTQFEVPDGGTGGAAAAGGGVSVGFVFLGIFLTLAVLAVVMFVCVVKKRRYVHAHTRGCCEHCEHCEHCEDAGNVIHRGRLMDDVMLVVYFVVFVVR